MTVENETNHDDVDHEDIEEEFEDTEDYEDFDEDDDDGIEDDDDDEDFVEDDEDVDEDGEDSEDADEGGKVSGKRGKGRAKGKSADDKLTYAFQRKNRQLSQARQAAAAAEERARQAEEALLKHRASQRPKIPDLPDAYDPDFQNKMALRDKAIQDAAAFDIREQTLAQQRQQQENNQRQNNNVNWDQLNNEHKARGAQIGIGAAQLDEMENIIIDAVGPNIVHLGETILKHPRSPEIVKSLSNDMTALMELSDMTPVEAGMYIQREVLPKLGKRKSVKKGTSKRKRKTPRTLKSRGSTKRKRPFLKGATFE